MHSFRGCYHYESSEALDRALAAAREYLDDDELTDLEHRLFAGFRRHGASLFIDATMPLADRTRKTALSRHTAATRGNDRDRKVCDHAQ